MNAIVIETRLWYCHMSVTTKNESKSKYFTFKTQKHKKAYGTVVKENSFCYPEIDEVNYILKDTNKSC